MALISGEVRRMVWEAARRLAAGSLVLLLVGCAGPGPSSQPTPTAITSGAPSPDVTLGPSPSPLVTTAPKPSEIAVATPTDAECPLRPYTGSWSGARLLPGEAIKVSVAELNIRAGPCTAAKKFAPLKKGKLMIVSSQPFGPVKADGYAWYQVLDPPNTPNDQLPALPERWFPDGTDTSFGWIAVADASTAFVKPVAARCPTTVDLENVQAMLPAEWLACFSAPIVLQGTFGCGGCGGESNLISEPRWLAGPFEFDQLHIRWGDEFQSVSVPIHFGPDGPASPTDGSIIRVTVHLDDPAAQTCRFEWPTDDSSFIVPKEYAISWCRERFVVDSYEVIGTDPKYEGA
jgi:hypothetical protein